MQKERKKWQKRQEFARVYFHLYSTFAFLFLFILLSVVSCSHSLFLYCLFLSLSFFIFFYLFIFFVWLFSMSIALLIYFFTNFSSLFLYLFFSLILFVWLFSMPISLLHLFLSYSPGFHSPCSPLLHIRIECLRHLNSSFLLSQLSSASVLLIRHLIIHIYLFSVLLFPTSVFVLLPFSTSSWSFFYVCIIKRKGKIHSLSHES